VRFLQNKDRWKDPSLFAKFFGFSYLTGLDVLSFQNIGQEGSIYTLGEMTICEGDRWSGSDPDHHGYFRLALETPSDS
jgi:hypothetical protein